MTISSTAEQESIKRPDAGFGAVQYLAGGHPMITNSTIARTYVIIVTVTLSLLAVPVHSFVRMNTVFMRLCRM